MRHGQFQANNFPTIYINFQLDIAMRQKKVDGEGLQLKLAQIGTKQACSVEARLEVCPSLFE